VGATQISSYAIEIAERPATAQDSLAVDSNATLGGKRRPAMQAVALL
jgi:hypothetical protein